MNIQKRKAAVVGALNVDIGGVPEAPFVPGDSIPGRVSVSLGGVGWNIARDLASLGPETAFFSVLGLDGHAADIRADAAEFGVSLENCLWADAPNNRYLYIAGGELAAAVNDMRLCERMDAAFIEACLPQLADSAVVVGDANLPEEALEALCAGVSAPLVMDCVSAVKCVRLRGLLRRVHTLKANRTEAEALTGRSAPAEAVRALLDAGVKRAVVSLGREGALCGEGGDILSVPAEPGPAADVTGAGDSLTAALAAGLARGLALADCAALGMRAAALTMAQPGAVTKRLSELSERKESK